MAMAALLAYPGRRPRRHGMKLLICIINDGGYGAETHKFRSWRDPHATRGRGDQPR
jgi:hypothetical protein